MLGFVSVVFAALLGVAATQTSGIADAAEALRQRPVYVEDGATVLDADDADRLVEAIEGGDRAVYIAALTDETVQAEGGLNAALESLYRAVDLEGTYAVVSDEGFRAGSTNLPSGQASELATAAFNANRDGGAYAVLADFVARVNGREGGGESTGGDSEPDSGGSLMPLLLVGGGIAGGAYLISRSRRANQARAHERVRLQGAQQDLLAELSVLSDDVLRLEPEVDLHPAARPDYDAAVSRYRWLEAAIPQIDSADDPPRIQRAMTEARYAMARAQAIVRGLEPPAPPPELTHEGRYGEPAIEIDETDEYRRPRYAGYRGGWYGGGFFGGNDLFTGLLLGSMLGGPFGGWGWGGGFGHSHDGGDGDGDGGWGGDFGGGDFGGGDFGGGDFGGGDFGGGDW